MTLACAYIYRSRLSSVQVLCHDERHVIAQHHINSTQLALKENNSLDVYLNNLNMHFEKKYFVFGTRSAAAMKEVEYSKMSDLWKSVDDGIGANRKLYSKNLKIDEILTELKTAKIRNITFFLNRPTIKWMLTLDGGQKALFKPELNDENSMKCKSGCEHPAYEVTGFAINRMLGLNTMPFTTIREINWVKDIVPIANRSFVRHFSVYQKGANESKVCVKWTCKGLQPSMYCFPKGRILGSVMYWINDDVLELRHYALDGRYGRYHPMYFKNKFKGLRVQSLRTGDSRFCDKFRRKPPYNDPYHFMYTLDMAVEDFLTQSKNSKHNILFLDSSNTSSSNTSFLNIVIDKGKGFCPHEDDLLLAPVYQCCKIRRTVYEALLGMNRNFVQQFRKATHLERSDTLVREDQLTDIENRIDIILDYVQRCFTIKGINNVLM